MSENSKASMATLWVSVGIAVFLPQIILIARNWGAFVELAPVFGGLLLQVVAVAGAVAISAAIAAVAVAVVRRARARAGAGA